MDPALAAAVMAQGAMQAALITRLVKIGVLSDQDVKELLENALLMLETQQATGPSIQDFYVLARELIEQHLRLPPKP